MIYAPMASRPFINRNTPETDDNKDYQDQLAARQTHWKEHRERTILHLPDENNNEPKIPESFLLIFCSNDLNHILHMTRAVLCLL